MDQKQQNKVLLISQPHDGLDLIREIVLSLRFELIDGDIDIAVNEQIHQHQPQLVIVGADFVPDHSLFNPPVLLIVDCDVSEQIEKFIASGVSEFLFLPLNRAIVTQRISQQMLLSHAQSLQHQCQMQQLKLQDLGELIGLVSHEIASPLGNINTAVSFLLESGGVIQSSYDIKKLAASDLERFLVRLNRALTMSVKNGNNASSIINSFRNVATNECLERLNHFYLHRYLDDVILTLKSKLKKLPHEIHVVIGESVEMVTYSGVMAQIITALINKSIEYGFDDKVAGKIIISAMVKNNEQGGERVVINYLDDGCGIPKSCYQSLFQKPQTVSIEPKQHLSFNMIKGLVEHKLQGTLSVTSVLGEGVSCTMDLPQKLLVN